MHMVNKYHARKTVVDGITFDSMAEARRYQLEQNKRRSFPSHTVIYGASLVVRTMLTLTQRAIELLTGEPPPLSFVKDEAAARARLDTARANLRPRAK